MRIFIVYLAAFFTATAEYRGPGWSSFSSGGFLHQPSGRDKHIDLPTKQPPHTQCNRAFIIADASYPFERVLFINSDIYIGDTGIERTIVFSLASLYGDPYMSTNTALVGTHTRAIHSYPVHMLPPGIPASSDSNLIMAIRKTLACLGQAIFNSPSSGANFLVWYEGGQFYQGNNEGTLHQTNPITELKASSIRPKVRISPFNAVTER
ncbi:hypothetical protein BDR03DRAFT_982834 [Suillus americanus]|nr:hypothetical protein BDR03DRAFT_982834 [Suillus americanus]